MPHNKVAPNHLEVDLIMAEDIVPDETRSPRYSVVQYSQTKGLAVEIWNRIFRDASRIDNVEDFTARAGAHNRLEWNHMVGIREQKGCV
jgi:hypothetical protein